MPDVMPDASTPPAAAPAAGDPFQRLHKMSTTAGLGAGDYVAISGTAIASVLLAVASALVLLHDRILLVLPLAGVVCAILAFRQIARSNGTQTGNGLAVLGLLLSLALGGFEGGRQALAGNAARRSQAQVVSLIHDFGADVAAKRYDAAYAYCDDSFRQVVPMDRFAAVWRQAHDSALLGSIVGMDWNGLLTFDTDLVTGTNVASGMMLIRFDKSAEPFRSEVVFRQTADGWKFDQLPQLFAEQAAKPEGRSGAASPGGGGRPRVYGPPKPS